MLRVSACILAMLIKNLKERYNKNLRDPFFTVTIPIMLKYRI